MCVWVYVLGDDSDYWGVDEDSVVFVADPNFGNILNFNVGSNIDIQIPPNFWTRLTSTYTRPLLHLSRAHAWLCC